MNYRGQITRDVERVLALDPLQAAEIHMQREADGWNMQFGFLPFERRVVSVSQVVAEVASALGFHVTQRNVDMQIMEIDAYSVGYEQLLRPGHEQRVLARGVGLWLPQVVEVAQEPISGSDET